MYSYIQLEQEYLREMETYLLKYVSLESAGIYGWNCIMDD
jgi:nicotinamide riboside transporter PnuC